MTRSKLIVSSIYACITYLIARKTVLFSVFLQSCVPQKNMERNEVTAKYIVAINCSEKHQVAT